MKRLIAETLIFISIATALIGGVAWLAISVPVVEVSHSTGECVRVYDPAGRYSCEHLPPHYEHTWTK